MGAYTQRETSERGRAYDTHAIVQTTSEPKLSPARPPLHRNLPTDHRTCERPSLSHSPPANGAKQLCTVPVLAFRRVTSERHGQSYVSRVRVARAFRWRSGAAHPGTVTVPFCRNDRQRAQAARNTKSCVPTVP